MNKVLKGTLAIMMVGTLMTSCKKNEAIKTNDEVSDAVKTQVTAMGFSSDGIQKANGGYLVEGDIFLSNDDLGKQTTSKSLVIANEEHYRTTNLVTRLPRTITVSVSAGSPSYFFTAADEAIRRYNALGMRLTMTRVTGTADINIVTFYQVSNTLGSSGFPDASGNPYNTIQMNTYWYSASTNIGYLASIMAHEMGHCVGFRHTDYMNRQYSCGGRKYNEGAAGVGAIWIPGTPTGPDANSWMLACSNGTDRPFTTNDQIALNALYK
jgi:hypothetical protein